MKITFFFLSILISLGSASCQTKKSDVTVKGKFIGDIPEEVKYSIPINGICYGFFQASERVDSMGNFEFRFNIEDPSFIKIFTYGNTGQLIVEPGETYLVTIESNKRNIKFNVDGKNTSMQSEYQRLDSPEHPQMLIMEFINSPISTAKNKIDSMYTKEVATFRKLSVDGLISKELFDLILLDRKLFYSCAQGQLAMIKFSKAKVKENSANTDSINQMWDEAISSVPLNSNNLLKSKWAYYYLENYLMYREYTAKDFSFDIRTKARNNGNIHSYLIGIAKKYLKGEILEFYTSSYILSTAWQNKFEKELIGLFEEFTTDFPNSKYTASLEPHIEKIIAFHKRAEQKFDENSKFLSNYENINSLAECVKTFSGKKVYVDIWTTSCGPCKDEFKYSEDLKQLLLSNNTAMLYISLDSDNTDTRWKDMIKFYQLTGYHVRANKELEADLEKILGSLWIPRYLLIDENGKIANNNAKRPSQLKDLEKQIIGK